MEQSKGKTWWREARFGMFIHWGIYSLKAKGEWVMYVDRIPVREYEKLAGEFNPVQFDAEEWVKLAKSTGMKYIIITAKHHDGFSMFRTKVSGFNIVDATPYKRDVMLDLARACEKHGLRLCFYYSHVREWRHPHAQSLEEMSPSRYGNFGNFWDYRDECRKNLQVYIDEFDKPQIRELLTQYGPIGVIWFDTPSLIRPDQAQELVDLVKSLQPDCLVNSRVGDFVDFDYHSLGDAEVPDYGTGVDWETPMTICHAWGYNNQPSNRYRDVDELIHQLVDIVSLGGNYLLNVGPDARGVIPEEAQARLRVIGEWMWVNGESIHGTTASPFSVRPSWGRITARRDALYLHVYKWSSRIMLTGLQGRVRAVSLLADPRRKLKWTQAPVESLAYDRLAIDLPGQAPDAHASVVKVQFEEPVQVETRIIEDDAGGIELASCRATAHTTAGRPSAGVSVSGIVRDWLSTNDWFGWEFLCASPGTFDVTVTMSTGFHGNWDFGHELVIACGDQESLLRIEDTGVPTAGFQKRTFPAGTIRIGSAGLHRLTIRATKLSRANGQGFQMSSVNLHPHRG